MDNDTISLAIDASIEAIRSISLNVGADLPCLAYEWDNDVAIILQSVHATQEQGYELPYNCNSLINTLSLYCFDLFHAFTLESIKERLDVIKTLQFLKTHLSTINTLYRTILLRCCIKLHDQATHLAYQ